MSRQPNRRPVIVGLAQISQKLEDPRLARSPLDLMEQAIRGAIDAAIAVFPLCREGAMERAMTLLHTPSAKVADGGK